MKSLIQKQIEENINSKHNAFDNKGDSLMNTIANRDKLLKVGLDELSLEQVTNVKKEEPENMTGKVNMNKKVSKFKKTIGKIMLFCTLAGVAAGITKVAIDNFPVEEPPIVEEIPVDQERIIDQLTDVQFSSWEEYKEWQNSLASETAEHAIKKQVSVPDNYDLFEMPYFETKNNDLTIYVSANLQTVPGYNFNNKIVYKCVQTYTLSNENMNDLNNMDRSPEKIAQIVQYVVHNFEAKQESLLKLERYANSVLDQMATDIANFNISRQQYGARYGGGAWGYDEKTGEIQMLCLSETNNTLKINLKQTGGTYANNALIGITDVNDADFFNGSMRQNLKSQIYSSHVFNVHAEDSPRIHSNEP